MSGLRQGSGVPGRVAQRRIEATFARLKAAHAPGLVTYVTAGDPDLERTEGILPALESAHAVAYLAHLKSEVRDGTIILVNLSGRGDKDVQSVVEALR